MQRALSWLTLIAVVVLATDNMAWGNAAPPPEWRVPAQQPEGVPLTYHEEASAVSRLKIPRQFLEQARLPKADVESATLKGAQTSNHWRTLIAAVTLSLAAVSLVLIRNKNRAVKVTVLVAAVGIATFAAAQAISAEAPHAPAKPPQDAANAGGNATIYLSKVVIEIVDQGNSVEFVRGTNPAN